MITPGSLRLAFPLPLRFDVERLRSDLAILRRFPQSRLDGEFGRGRWGGVGLFAVGGKTESLVCSDEPCWPTEALQACPYLREVLAGLDAPKRSVRALSLSPGATVFEHCDPDSSYDRGTVRLHLPITTHPDVDFYLAGSRVVMRPGELWYGDFAFPHRLRNRSPVERVHVVIDLELTQAIRRLFPEGYEDGAPLRHVHRTARCWVSARKAAVLRAVSRRLS